MRFRTGIVIGFAVGYYYGAKAGRARYRQLNDLVQRVRSQPRVEEATVKAREVVDRATEAATTRLAELSGRAVDEVAQRVDDLVEGDLDERLEAATE